MNNYLPLIIVAALVYFLTKNNTGNPPGGNSPTGTSSGPQQLRGFRHASV